MACDSKTLKDEVTGMENSSIAGKKSHWWEERTKRVMGSFFLKWPMLLYPEQKSVSVGITFDSVF